jgi:hypothetical protein
MVALGTNTKVVALVGETDTSWICQDLDHSGFGFQRIPGVTYTLGTFHWIPWVTQYQGYWIKQHILSQPFMKTSARIDGH